MHTVLLSKCKINLQLKYFLHMLLASFRSNRPYGFHQQQNLEDTVEEREAYGTAPHPWSCLLG